MEEMVLGIPEKNSMMFVIALEKMVFRSRAAAPQCIIQQKCIEYSFLPKMPFSRVSINNHLYTKHSYEYFIISSFLLTFRFLASVIISSHENVQDQDVYKRQEIEERSQAEPASKSRIIQFCTASKMCDEFQEDNKAQNPNQVKRVGQSIQFNQQSTILLVRNVACSEELQVTLINEINKLYREINKLKLAAQEEEKIKEQAAKDNRLVRNKLEVLEREYAMYREMYELEKENHERLRKFYEQREKEWMAIVSEHRKILEEYDQRSNNSLSDIENKSEYTQLESMYANFEEMLSHSYLKEPASKETKQPAPEKRGRRKLRSSIDREDSLSQPKLRLKLNSHKDTNFYTDVSHLQQERKERTPFKMRHQPDSMKLTPRSQPIAQKNAQADELFDSIVRKTYYRYKEKSIPVSEIEQLEDMIKLKNAKTSTKERLAKTIRKLDFPINNDQELKVLCECVERAVLEKYKVLRGDYAFQLLIDKLKECEKLALSSNSELERLDPKSQMTNQDSQLRSKCLYNDPSLMLKESDIYRGGQKSIELLLDSTIKDQKKGKGTEEDLSQRIKFSGMYLRKDSDLHDPSGLGVQSRYISGKAASGANDEPSER